MSITRTDTPKHTQAHTQTESESHRMQRTVCLPCVLHPPGAYFPLNFFTVIKKWTCTSNLDFFQHWSSFALTFIVFFISRGINLFAVRWMSSLSRHISLIVYMKGTSFFLTFYYEKAHISYKSNGKLRYPRCQNDHTDLYSCSKCRIWIRLLLKIRPCPHLRPRSTTTTFRH